MSPASVTSRGRYTAVTVAFLGWMCAGVQMGTLPIASLFFGWLPLCLPELFPTRVRATGAGLSYNFGRFLVAGAVLAAGALTHFFGGHYAKAGAIMGLIYGLGMIAIWFSPDPTGKRLAD